MKDLIEHERSIVQVKSPLPFPLRWVNSYIIGSSSGYTIIDPGLHTEAAKQRWLDVLKERNIQFKEIGQIVLTHHHPDHYGLAGWFQQKTNANVYMSPTAQKQAMSLWGEKSQMNQELITLFRQHGMPKELLDAMLSHLESFISFVSPQPKVDFIYPGKYISLGSEMYLMIEVNGHAAGQLCFYNEKWEEMFCGDQVIPQITPNVSYLPGGDSNPLQSFITSLQEISTFSVQKAYPGHRDPFPTFQKRISEIIDHHDTRLLQIFQLLSKPQNTYELCVKLFGSGLSIHQLRFAMAETLAHLLYLEKKEKISGGMLNDIMVYKSEQ